MKHAKQTMIVAIALLACAQLHCASFPGSLEPPEVFVVNLVPQESTPFEQRLRVDLRVLNPNNRSLRIRGVDFRLALNGSPLARGFSAEEADIPRLGESIVSVVASTTLLDLVRQVFVINENSNFDFEISGNLHLGGGLRRSLSFQQSGSLKGFGSGTSKP